MTFTPPSSHAGGYPLGLTGATSPTRYVGATAAGPPTTGTFAVGDFVVDQTGEIYVCTTAGTPGTWIALSQRPSALRVTGSSYAVAPRYVAGGTRTITSQTVYLAAIDLPAGLVVTSISFGSSATALVAGVHQYFGLYDSARALLRATNDDGATAWAASAVKTLTLTAPFTTTYAGLYYLAILVDAATPPSLACPNTGVSSAAALLQTPTIGGSSDTGRTTLPNPAAAITALTAFPWAYVS